MSEEKLNRVTGCILGEVRSLTGPDGRERVSLRNTCERVSGRRHKKCMVLRQVMLGVTNKQQMRSWEPDH